MYITPSKYILLSIIASYSSSCFGQENIKVISLFSACCNALHSTGYDILWYANTALIDIQQHTYQPIDYYIEYLKKHNFTILKQYKTNNNNQYYIFLTAKHIFKETQHIIVCGFEKNNDGNYLMKFHFALVPDNDLPIRFNGFEKIYVIEVLPSYLHRSE